MWTYILSCIIFILSLGLASGQTTQCEEPPNVAVIVVASVFTTLAVILVVFGIIFFCLWKRRRDLLKPSTPVKRVILDEDQDLPSPDVGVHNPAFNDSDIPANVSLAEEGVSGYTQCKDNLSPGKKKTPKSGNGQSPLHKPWSSLPSSDLPPGIQRNGSVGSFDDNFFGVEPEVSSVWLQSQDFIGLGFNIAGSMRDGIYVSQVHNRGPAIESGQFKVGDRILSVTISFENMVYEDALTILSYASPYPVRVTLQKEKHVRKDRRASETPSTLSHPLFRSHSMDTLKKVRKDSAIAPQRSFSEMRPEKKKAVQQKLSPSSAKGGAFPTIQENGSKHGSRNLTDDEVFKNETVVVVEQSEDELDASKGANGSTSDAKQFAAQLFDDLNEQDKLDMLRLSYEDPSDESKIVLSETSFTETSVVETRSAKPVKPERRKKKTSSGSSVSSSDTPNSPRTSFPPPDTYGLLQGSQATAEVAEDVITPANRDRNVTLTSDKIEFSDIDVTLNADSSPDLRRNTLVDYSLSDMDSTLRPVTPDNGPTVEEDTITPEHTKRGTVDPGVFQKSPSDSSENDETVIRVSGSSSSLSGSDDEKNESKLQNTSTLDFNVTSSNPSLFSTPYPSRNTKEAVSGMSYDISMNELNDIETEMRKKSKDKPKGGIAFEVRDDFTSGTVRSVPVESKSATVVRTMSYFDKNSVEQHEKIMQMTRTGSFTDAKKDVNNTSLDWSGKRLVRSGSFTDIPQNDSVHDWRDHNMVDDSETINSEDTSLRDDLISSNDSINEVEQKGLKKSNYFRARENLANLSDNSESLQSLHSLTESSSRGSSPPPSSTNGSGLSPDKYSTDNDNNIIPAVKIENKENIRVSVSVQNQDDDDTDC